MTPAEQARRIVEGLLDLSVAPIVKDWLAEEIEQAINEAVAAKQEQCAQIADAVADDGSAADLSRFYARVIAERIRKG